MKFLPFGLSILFMLPMLLAATSAVAATPAVSSAKIAALGAHPQWRALLHYRQRLFGAPISTADDDKFFISQAGVRDARAELAAELDAMATTLAADADLDAHPQCKFPARFLWLKQHLPEWGANIISYKCPKLSAWLDKMRPESATLVFPSAYLNSPASMYGHTLFRINGSKDSQQNRLLAHSISYAADMPSDINGLEYIIGGLFGGYPGHMYEDYYYDKIIQYGDMEHRDIWEYPVKLDETELDFMLRHIWELQHVRFDYYFFDENCSLRLLDILDVAIPNLNSAADFSTHAIPVDTVRALQQRGVLGAAQYRPAVLSKLHAQIKRFSKHEQDFLKALVFGKRELAEFASLFPDPKRRAQAVDFAYEYLRYNALSKTIDKATASRRSLQLLSFRSKLPEVSEFSPPVPPAAEEGHNTARMSIGAGYAHDMAYINFDARPAFHDLLDNDAGYVNGSQLEFFVLKLRYYPELKRAPLKLQHFKFVDVQAMAARDKFFFPWSWQATFGFFHDDWRSEYADRFGIKAGRGLTFALGQSLRLSTMLLADFNIASKFKGSADLAVGGKLGAIYTLPSYAKNLAAKLQLDAEYWEYESSRAREGWHLGAALNLPFTVDNAVRLRFNQHLGKNGAAEYQYQLNYQHFF